MAALEVRGLGRRYGARVAVDGVDLSIEPGEIHGLVGPNGAGKTTLLRMLLGLVRPDAGEVRLLGQAPREGVLPSGVAGYADTPRFYPFLSARENLALLARLDDEAGGAPRARRVADALAEAGLGGHEDAKVVGYSAGMTQRLGLSAALLRAPRLLVLDEPAHTLDPAGAKELSARLRRLAADGVAVLLSSHDLAEVEALCPRITVLDRGRVLFAGAVEDLRRRAPAPRSRLQTSDDARALALSRGEPDLVAEAAADGEGLDVSGTEAALDRLVVALGRAGVAVRRLSPRAVSLEALFLSLTSSSPREDPRASPPVAPRAAPDDGRAPLTLAGVRAVASVEASKLAAQAKARVVLAVCVAGPLAFAAAMRTQSSLPEDTLFGRWVNASGFALPLVVLGFAASWAFPVLTSVVAGDLFASEDRHGTWPILLGRSRSRAEVFAGKTLVAMGFTVAAVALLALSSVAAGRAFVGGQPLVDLGGVELSAGSALGRVALAWASALPPALGFTALACLLSVATRSSAAGVGLPVLLGFGMELGSLVDGPALVRRLWLTPPFVAWHGLFEEPPTRAPLLYGAAISVAYLAGCLAAAYELLRRRDVGR